MTRVIKQDPLHALRNIMDHYCSDETTKRFVYDWIDTFAQYAQGYESTSKKMTEEFKDWRKYSDEKMLAKMVSHLVSTADIVERETDWGIERRFQVLVLRDRRDEIK